MKHERIIDFDDPQQRGKVAAGVQRLRGRWRLELTRYRPRRSDRQNRYYWPCFVQPFKDWLRAQGHEANDRIAHEVLKSRFLKTALGHKATGEMMGEYVKSTTELDTSEFNIYLDQCAEFLSEFCEIVVPDASDYYEQDATPSTRT